MSGVIMIQNPSSIKKEEKLEGGTVLAMVYGTGKIAKKGSENKKYASSQPLLLMQK